MTVLESLILISPGPIFLRSLSALTGMWINKAEREKIDYVSICSPNYLHDAHIRFALRSNAHVICEKPLVLNPWNIDALEEIEAGTDFKAYNILQLRLHPALIKLKKEIDASPDDKKYELDLTYITSRGKWYFIS